MSNLKTFEDHMAVDPLMRKQKQDVAKMRTSLLACDADPRHATTALKNVAVLHVYHQMSRIVRYTEMCDKLEEKLYACMENVIDNADETSPFAMNTLMNIQERLQKLIIESNKLLAPYMNVAEFVEENTQEIVDDENVVSTTISLDSAKREKLRNSAKEVLKQLNVG